LLLLLLLLLPVCLCPCQSVYCAPGCARTPGSARL